jgi:hypothetical protein
MGRKEQNMADPSAENHSIDTAPLQPKQLSDHEWNIIFEIEERLREVPPADNERKRTSGNVPTDRNRGLAAMRFAPAETRYQRVLLLDGARGTGKTSVLLTLIERWHEAAGYLTSNKWELDVDDQKRANALRSAQNLPPNDGKAPSNVHVIRNLDFDPLPWKMPLIAGIVQSWRALAEYYDPEKYPTDELIDDDGPWRLMDRWHRLFQVAALGWMEIATTKGLIEQVLDREEQVRDWQSLREQWTEFVDEAVRVTVRQNQTNKDTSSTPVFVIVIDDVDLQVRRIRELLPALRLLTHPNVFFLVAAHAPHMLAMLKLDFLGQQQELARHRNASQDSALTLAEADEWSSPLADSAVEKVFPTRNHWELKELSLLEFLAYPNPIAATPGVLPGGDAAVPPATSDAFETLLDKLNSKSEPPGAGKALRDLANAADSVQFPLPLMTYRSAQQLRSAVTRMKDTTQATLAGLVSRAADEGADIVRRTDGGVDIPATGDLAALYRPGLVEPGGIYNVVLSARPDFVFVQRGKPKVRLHSTSPKIQRLVTAALVAKTLEERDFPVDASGIRWDTYSSFIWTEWPGLNALFAWNRLRHPRPDQLFEHTKEWATFLGSLEETKDKLERFAYAWIFYQKKWSEHELDDLVDPATVGKEPFKWKWQLLLKQPRLIQGAKLTHDSKENERWTKETLPLLARPEIGLPPRIQKLLLSRTGGKTNLVNLQRQRERLVTDALYAGGIQAGQVEQTATQERVRDVIKQIDSDYEAYQGLSSPWRLTVERKPTPTVLRRKISKRTP